MLSEDEQRLELQRTQHQADIITDEVYQYTSHFIYLFTVYMFYDDDELFKHA